MEWEEMDGTERDGMGRDRTGRDGKEWRAAAICVNTVERLTPLRIMGKVTHNNLRAPLLGAGLQALFAIPFPQCHPLTILGIADSLTRLVVAKSRSTEF